jgi:hypothetical protein
MRTAAVALLLLLAACGGGSDETAGPKASTATSAAEPTAQPSTAPTTGAPVPEALSGFRCAADDKGDWAAKGVVANDGKAVRTFQVTVLVGSATGGDEQAKTTQVASVAPGGSAPFTIKKVPAPDDGGTCHVQVLASR